MNDLTAFNIASLWQVLVRRWKIIAAFVGTVLIATLLLLLFVVPKFYKSKAVIIAANPALADKARLLNSNIQQLYSPYGSGDDLNRLYAIARLDSLHYQLVQEFDLVKYYHEGNEANAIKLAVKALEDDLEIMKTENDELHITVYTKDKNLSARIANRLVQLIDTTASRSWRREYIKSLASLERSIENLKQQVSPQPDTASQSLAVDVYSERRKGSTLKQLQQFEEVANEYRLAIASNPSSLVVLQAAYPSLSYDKPKKLAVMLGALLASLAFAIIAVLVYDNRSA